MKLAVLAPLLLASCWLTSSFTDLTGPTDSSAGDVGEGCLSSSTTYVQSVLAENPLAYWRLDDDGGSTAVDQTHHFDGTYSGTGITYRQPGAIVGDTSILLDGVAGDIEVVTTALAFPSKTPFSLEAWIKPVNPSTKAWGIISYQSSGGKEGYEMNLRGPSSAVAIDFERFQDAASTSPMFVATPPSSGWYHVVGTYDGATMSVYVNGQVVSAGSSLSISPNCMKLAIGSLLCGNGGWFNGYVDEVAIYDHALAPACVLAHCRQGSGSSCP